MNNKKEFEDSELWYNWGITTAGIITRQVIIAQENKIDINFNTKIKTESELDQLLEANNITKYVSLNYNRSEVEKNHQFLKKLWSRGVSYYSYGVKEINAYFGRKIIEPGTPTMGAYMINWLINLYNKEKYWDEFN